MDGSELVSDGNVRSFIASARSPFPHMSEGDVEVWTPFLLAEVISFESVIYDVGVGGRQAALVPDSEELKPMWLTLIRKRIDAVVFGGGKVWTIEVKPVAGMSALGQALTYRELWNREGRSETKARAMVVCSRVDDDVEELFTLFGVVVVVLDPQLSGPGAVLKILGAVD